MRLPLLLGARPLFVKKGALIPLGVGNWSVTGNHKDSQIFIDCIIEDISITHPLNGSPLILEGPAWVRVLVEKSGSEDSLDIYAEKVKE